MCDSHYQATRSPTGGSTSATGGGWPRIRLAVANTNQQVYTTKYCQAFGWPTTPRGGRTLKELMKDSLFDTDTQPPAVRHQANGNAGREDVKAQAFNPDSPSVRIVTSPVGDMDSKAANSVAHHINNCGLGNPSVRLAHIDGAQGDCSLKGEKGVPQVTDAPALLVSYYYLEPFLKEQHRYRYRDWVLDSGAFSAHNSGATIDLGRYVDTCLELLEKDPSLTEVFALDVIGNAEASLKNCEEMWRQGVEAIPCFHAGEPEEFLLHIAKKYPKIALGGVALERGDFKFDFCQQCFARVWPKKIHGFGMSSPQMVYNLPFHSVDATNWEIAPCLGADTMVSVTQGLIPIGELVGKTFSVNTYQQRVVPGCTAISKGIKKTITIRLRGGQSIRCTPNHKILTVQGWKEAGELKEGSMVRIPDAQLRPPVIAESLLDEMLGWMVGDGWFCESSGRICSGILFADGDREAMDKLAPVWDEFCGKARPLSAQLCRTGTSVIYKKSSESKTVAQKLLAFGFKPCNAIKKELPSYIWTAKPEQQLAFLRGLFSADGCIGDKRKAGYISIKLASSSIRLMHQVQLLLIDYGIRSSLDGRKPWLKNWQGQLSIYGESARAYMEMIGFNIARKHEGFWKGNKWTRDQRKFLPIKSIEANSPEQVYDVVMPSVHHFVGNGIVVHNCAFGNWEKYGTMSVRGSNQDLRSQVKHYLEMEAKARVRWTKEMELLEKLEPTKRKAGPPPTVRLACDAGAAGGLHAAGAFGKPGESKNKNTPRQSPKPKEPQLTGELADRWQKNWWE